jgi:hypothetical protein
MGYRHTTNLYRPEAQCFFLLRECYASEKIHGTSAHVSWKDGEVHLFAGGESLASFIKIFDLDALKVAFETIGHPEIIVFGEAYGGKQQGQSWRYGKQLKFIAFEVKVGDRWLSVPDADQVAQRLGLEFVHYRRVPVEIAALDAERDAPSEQARRNGVEGDQPREGVVLRALQEIYDANGERFIFKHKRAEERETRTVREVGDPAKLKVLEDAEAIAAEWVTPTRLEHVLDKLGNVDIKDTPKVIAAMLEDVQREGAGEFIDSKDARRAIGSLAARLFKKRVMAVTPVA